MKKADHAKSIAAKLSKLSKAQKIPYESLATAFLLERLLARLVSNPQLAKSLVFKGGYVGLRVYNSARYTIDLDALLLKSNATSTLKRTAQAIEGDIEDGAWFVFESQIDLRTQGEYGGIRQTFRAGVGEKPKDLRRSRIINFDVGIGDPVTPAPVKAQTKEFIGEGELNWQIYPIETIIAEKFQTIVVRADQNSRAKDIFDLYYYLPKANSSILKRAIKRCFEFRRTEMPDDPIEYLSKIDVSLLKRGWKTATISLQEAPSFDEAFESIIDELKKVFPSPRTRSKK